MARPKERILLPVQEENRFTMNFVADSLAANFGSGYKLSWQSITGFVGRRSHSLVFLFALSQRKP